MSTGNGSRPQNTRVTRSARQLQVHGDLPTLNIDQGNQLVAPRRGQRSAHWHAQNVSMARVYGDHPVEVASQDYNLERAGTLSYEPELVYTAAPVVSDPSIEGPGYTFPLDKWKRHARDLLSRDEGRPSSEDNKSSFSSGRCRMLLDGIQAQLSIQEDWIRQESDRTHNELTDLRWQMRDNHHRMEVNHRMMLEAIKRLSGPNHTSDADAGYLSVKREEISPRVLASQALYAD
ncbi:hypothetical protein BC826DRAFT_971881 [Russula brevipes]|nr:hypothetical protein BC826DRAFT_971881 [Russula brevipes]